MSSSAGSSSSPSSGSPPLPRVAVVGAGPGGLAVGLALTLSRTADVTVFERRTKSDGGGLGLAVGLWSNAWGVLDALGVAADLRRDFLRATSTELCNASSTSSHLSPLNRFDLSDVFSDFDPEFRYVHRGALRQVLESGLERAGGRPVEYGSALSSLRTTVRGTVELKFEGGRAAEFDAVVGADGVRSKVRAAVLPGDRDSAVRYSGYTCWRGLATFPDGVDPGLLPVRQTYGAGVRLGSCAMTRTQVHWFVCANAEARGAGMREEVAEKVARWPSFAEALVGATGDADLVRTDISDRDPLWPWALRDAGPVTLLGDAWHPMTPNLGQGGCVALEDALALVKAVAERPGDLAGAFRKYEQRQAPRAAFIALKSRLVGFLVQLDAPAIVALRDIALAKVFNPALAFAHIRYTPGEVPWSPAPDTYINN